MKFVYVDRAMQSIAIDLLYLNLHICVGFSLSISKHIHLNTHECVSLSSSYQGCGYLRSVVIQVCVYICISEDDDDDMH